MHVEPLRATPSVKALVEYEKSHRTVLSLYHLGLENG